MQGVNEMEMKAMARMQTNIIKLCFDECISNFSSNQISSGEQKCLANCAVRQGQGMMVMGQAQQAAMSKMGGGMSGNF